MNDTNEIKSIWDGWERQAFGMFCNLAGAECARGFLGMRDLRQKAVEADPVITETYRRVADFLRAQYSIAELGIQPAPEWWSSDATIIAQANNVLRLTPEQFREIDRLTQIEAVSKPLIESVEIAAGVSA